jgi:hypothetical protein
VAFRTQAINSFDGTAGRKIIDGPGMKNVDMGVFRAFRIIESKSLQFRAESTMLSTGESLKSRHQCGQHVEFRQDHRRKYAAGADGPEAGVLTSSTDLDRQQDSLSLAIHEQECGPAAWFGERRPHVVHWTYGLPVNLFDYVPALNPGFGRFARGVDVRHYESLGGSREPDLFGNIRRHGFDFNSELSSRRAFDTVIVAGASSFGFEFAGSHVNLLLLSIAQDVERYIGPGHGSRNCITQSVHVVDGRSIETKDYVSGFDTRTLRRASWRHLEVRAPSSNRDLAKVSPDSSPRGQPLADPLRPRI